MEVHVTYERVAIEDINLSLSNSMNPCDPHNDKLIRKIAKSLNTELPFIALNRGLTVLVAEDGDCSLTSGYNVISILDGGHTYEAIKLARRNRAFSSGHKVAVCIIRGKDAVKYIPQIAEARNNGQRLNAELGSNHLGSFDVIKRHVPQEWNSRIAWKSRTKLKNTVPGKDIIRACIAISCPNPSLVHVNPGVATKFIPGGVIHNYLNSFTSKGVITLMGLIDELSYVSKDYASIPSSEPLGRNFFKLFPTKKQKAVSFNIVLFCLSRLRTYFKNGEFIIPLQELVTSPEYVKALADLNLTCAENSQYGITGILRNCISWEL